MHWWVSDEMVARLVPHIQALCGRFPSINVRVEPSERKRLDGKRLLVMTDTSPRGLPERVLTCQMAAESLTPLLQPLPQAAGAHTPVQQNAAARSGASGDSRAGNSAEEKWLAELLGVIKSKRGQPLDLAVLANKSAGGVARPDGVKIKLRDFLTMHARRCGLVLTQQPDASGEGVTWTVVFDPNGASSSGTTTSPADRAQRSALAPDPVGEGGDANLCNICFEEQCDTRMMPCLHKICHNCVQVSRLVLSPRILLHPARMRFSCHARSCHDVSCCYSPIPDDNPTPSSAQLVKESTRLMGQDAECCPFCRERIKGFMGLYAKEVPKGKAGAAKAAAGAAAPRRETRSVKIGSKEEQWLASITAALKAKDGKPVEYGILSNPNFGGVPRPDGVNIKLGDLLRKHAAEWGFILTQQGPTKFVALARTPGKPRAGGRGFHKAMA